MSTIITQSSLDATNNHLTLSVPSDAVNELKRILSKDKPIGKAFVNIAKTYAFMCWMISKGQYHVSKMDLATMIYARHEESLTKAINILKENNLISVMRIQDKLKCRFYYTYNTYTFDYEKVSDETVEYEYDIPVCTCFQFYNMTGTKASGCPQTVCLINDPSSSSLHIYPTVSPFVTEGIAFKKTFLGWYNELCIGNKVFAEGHFSEKDGRFYHYFHIIPKDERLATVLWEGEYIVEKWDAHSAFFIVLGYYLKNYKQYESEDERRAFVEEADRLIKMAADNKLYDSILKYHNAHSEWHVMRDVIKEWVNAYKNQSYSNLFKKNGDRTNHKWAKRFFYIDDFFKINFPCIRDMMLNYPRHKELVGADIQNNGRLIHVLNNKSISNLQRDVMPYEFELISLGLCKDLYDLYKIKSVTVHDAIYVKQSDAGRITYSNINDLLLSRLGVSEVETRSNSYALF